MILKMRFLNAAIHEALLILQKPGDYNPVPY